MSPMMSGKEWINLLLFFFEGKINRVFFYSDQDKV
jgi:hypothetical protein